MKTTNINLKLCNVVMITTDKESKLHLIPKNSITYTSKAITTNECEEQHLYLTSPDEIKEGDWYILFDKALDGSHILKTVYKASKLRIDSIKKMPSCEFKKIIASTDAELGSWELGSEKTGGIKKLIPHIPDSFIQAFVKSNGNIKEVNVEWEWKDSSNKDYKGEIKIREDNTVIIHQCRTYTRDEVIEFIKDYRESILCLDKDIGLNRKWIEENL